MNRKTNKVNEPNMEAIKEREQVLQAQYDALKAKTFGKAQGQTSNSKESNSQLVNRVIASVLDADKLEGCKGYVFTQCSIIKGMLEERFMPGRTFALYGRDAWDCLCEMVHGIASENTAIPGTQTADYLLHAIKDAESKVLQTDDYLNEIVPRMQRSAQQNIEKQLRTFANKYAMDNNK